MSAVTFYLEEAFDESIRDTPADDYVNCVIPGQLRGGGAVLLGGLGARACKTPDAVVAQCHSAHTQTFIIRQAVVKVLAGRTLTPVLQGGEAYLQIDPPIRRDETPPWSPLPSEQRAQATLIAHVAKMNAPSFSLPAGSGALGGSCPGSAYGMTVERPQVVNDLAKKRRIALMTGMEPPTKQTQTQWYASAVCAHCYALVKNYQYTSNQLGQQMVYAWTQAAVAQGTFVPLMVQAIERSKFHDTSGIDKRLFAGPWQGYSRVFRIHDSGDFFSPAYLKAWKDIADHFVLGNPYGLTPTVFWAPTRLWANPATASWPRVNTPVRNLIIRPSGYHANARAPKLEGDEKAGQVAGSTVHAAPKGTSADAFDRMMMQQGFFDYVCPATKPDEGNTCLTVTGPDGKKGCRACWLKKDMVVSYGLH